MDRERDEVERRLRFLELCVGAVRRPPACPSRIHTSQDEREEIRRRLESLEHRAEAMKRGDLWS